jgi:AcrR family transcriptional regulator
MLQPVPQPKARPRGRPPIPGLRDSILQAAESVFARRDYHEVQMDDVAAACGVGKGTLYRYFPSKRELYLGVMFDGIERLRAELEAALATGDSPACKIERLVHQTLTHFWDRRFFFALIHQHEHRPDADAREWLRLREQLASLLRDTLEKAAAAGHIRRVNSRIAAEILLGMMRGVNRYRSADDRLNDLVGMVVNVFMGGIGTPAGRRALAKARQTAAPVLNPPRSRLPRSRQDRHRAQG